MANHFETNFVAYYAYLTAELHQFLKSLGQFENLVFVIMSTRENIRLIAHMNQTYGQPFISVTSPALCVLHQ